MVQIIPNAKKPSFLESLGSGIERGMYEGSKKKSEFEKMGFESELRRKEQQSKLQGEREIEGEDYQKIENAFGKKFADIWKSAPTGGKTELLKMGLESKLRGQDISEMFDQAGISEKPDSEIIDEEEEILSKPSKKSIDFDKGLTPRERTARQEKRYEKNLPLYQELEKRRTGLENEKDALNILKDLSPQIGGVERLNINPKTGELILPILASKEAQRFVKTINDFTTKAKDTYGSRVTNFELDRFLKRLPNLANSEEGRQEIIQQMGIINSINQARDDALNEIFEEYGGVRNIDYDQAERLAEKRSRSEVDRLKKEFSKIDASLDKRQKNVIEEKKKLTPKGKVSVEKADGRTGYVDPSKIENFLKLNPGSKVL